MLKNTKDEQKVWQFDMDDNLSLSDEYKTQLKSQFSGVFKKRFIEFGVLQMVKSTTFDPAKHCTDCLSIVSQLP